MTQHTKWQEFQRTPTSARSVALEELRLRLHQTVIADLGPLLYDQRASAPELKRQVQEALHAALAEEKAPLSAMEKAQMVQDVTDDVLGYGPIDRFLKDPEINEVMVNGPEHVYVERRGVIEHTDVTFADETHLRRIIDKIVSEVGRRVDEATPMVDARLPDGSRVNVVVPPLAIGGPFLTIRRFSVDPYTVDDLVNFGTLTPAVSRFVEACVQGKLNMMISGGTGTGKTTLLNVVSSFIPEAERIVTIEDAKELQLRQEHVLSLESRPSNIEGRGQVTIRDLVRNALRMRPDRIVVGEVRGAETLDMLQAMNTGHEGSITTVHANTPRDALARLETMTLMAGLDLPLRAIREQVASALDVVVHLVRLRDGSRRISQVSEVVGHGGRRDRPPGHLPLRLRHGRRRRGPDARPPQEHRHPPEVLGAARGPRHRPRSRALPSAGVRPQGGGTPMIVLLAIGVAVAMGLLAFVLLFVFANDDADVQDRLNDYAEDARASLERADGTTSAGGDQGPPGRGRPHRALCAEGGARQDREHARAGGPPAATGRGAVLLGSFARRRRRSSASCSQASVWRWS